MGNNVLKIFKFLFIFFFILFLLFPHVSQAIDISRWCGCLVLDAVCFLRCIANYLVSLPIRIFAAVIVTLFYLVAFIGILFAWIAELLAGLLILFSLQNAYNNAFYGVWLEVRNAAMWLIAVFLAFIGIATILRIESYGAKRAFFPLIMVALFLNFLPWITRTIIHIGNSFTVFFLTRLGSLRGQANTGQVEIGIIGSNVFRTLKDTLHQLGGAIQTIFTIDGRFMEAFFQVVQLDNGETRGPYILSIALIIVGAIFAAVFWIMYTFIILGIGFYFVVRSAYLWILFIISPLPFVTLPFTNTREIKAAFPGPLNWEGWLNQLLHWSFMGVPISFFIFIAGYLATMSPAIIPSNVDFNAVAGEFAGVATGTTTFVDESARQAGSHFNDILNSTFRYIPALVALSLGISISPGLMGSGLRGIWNVAKGFAIGGVVAGAALGGSLAKKITSPIAKRIPEPVRMRARQTIQRTRPYVQPYADYAKRQLGKLPGVGEIREAQKELMKAKLDSLERLSSEELRRRAEKAKSGGLSLEERKKILEILLRRGDMNKETYQSLFGGKNVEELNRIYGPDLVKNAMSQNPQWVAGSVINQKTGEAYTLGELIDSMSPDDIKNLSTNALENPEVLGMIFQDKDKTSRLRTLSQKKRVAVRKNITEAHIYAFDILAEKFNKEWGTHITGAQVRQAVYKNNWSELSHQVNPSQLKNLQERARHIFTQLTSIPQDPRFHV